MHAFRLAVVVLVTLFSLGCITVYEPRPSGGAGSPGGSSEKGASKSGPSGMKPWKTVAKDTEKVDGFLTFHRKKDGGLLLEISEEELERDFAMVLHFSQGLGVYNVHAGLRASSTVMLRFERHGNAIYMVSRNPRFTADQGSPMLASVEENTGHSILQTFPILSQKDEGKRLLVDATPFFVSDYVGMGQGLRGYHGGKPVGFDKKRSYVSNVQGFPKNVELDVMLTYVPSSPPTSSSAGLTDWRSVPVGLRYSLFALPEKPMEPRLADDRVGHFLTAVQDFSRDQEETSYVRFVNRWRLEKKDPEAETSPPVEPIVYYVDRSVPDEYRKWVKEGIEAWNKAFDAAGYENAIVAMDPPEDDPTWSAEDIRYSTVKWTAAHQMGYAIGPSQVDPRTGEILNADVLISSTFVRGWLFDYQEMGPDAMATALMEGERAIEGMSPEDAQFMCLAESGKSHQIAVQYALMAGLRRIAPGAGFPEDYLADAVRDLVMHEVGHTLGMRHNFRASSAIPADKLHDKSFTGEHGVSVSVMDYNPVNVTADGKGQGHYWSTVVGDYDVWAIRYAYTDMDEADAEGPLADLASRAAEPLLAYGTDEDASFGNFGVDPLTNRWDLGSDPVAYARSRAELVERISPMLEERLIEPGEGYQRLRSAYTSLLFERARSITPAVRNVGGLYMVRDHKGDPGARLPFTPVPAAKQREAVALIVDQALSEGAFDFEPETLNKMAPSRWSHWGQGSQLDPTFPAHAYVASIQASLVTQLMDPIRLSRMIDNELRVEDRRDAYTVAEMFDTVTEAVWSELGSDSWDAGSPRSVDSFRRTLQRAYVDVAANLLFPPDGPGSGPGVPEDVRSLARWSLTRIDERLAKIESREGRLDAMTQAHLAETRARIGRALDASVTLSIPRRSF